MNFISSLISQNATDYRKRIIPRDSVDADTTITCGSTMNIHGRIVDLSPYGCHVRIKGHLDVDSRIRILLPLLGDVEAYIAWSLTDCFGCRFSDTITRETYPQLLATIKMAKSMPRVEVPLMVNVTKPAGQP